MQKRVHPARPISYLLSTIKVVVHKETRQGKDMENADLKQKEPDADQAEGRNDGCDERGDEVIG